MIKTITIGEKEVKLQTHGATPILYKQHFGKDFFAEIGSLGSFNEDLSGFNSDVVYNLTWLFAKTADKDIPDTVIDWVMTFEEFPLMDIITDIIEVASSLMQQTKKK